MKPVKLAGLEPETLFGYFEKLCSIPHGSGNTKALSDYFLSFAQEQGLRASRDDAGNVILFKAASAGYEDHAPVILQAHMDMVCQKEDGCTLDMEKDPLDVTHDGEFVYARGTSLGGDDGSGVAFCLTLLADKNAVHPPLEVIFTNDEEIGLVGANQLDVSQLTAKRMINLDGAHEHIFTAGCAGGARVSVEMPLQKESCQGVRMSLTIDGLRGGHSGGLIHTKHANANKAMVELLLRIKKEADFQIVSYNGGTAGNAITKSCCAQIVLAQENTEKVKTICDAFLPELQETCNEQNATVCVQLDAETADMAYTAACTDKILGLIDELPNGMQKWNEKFQIANTSLNMGIVKTGETLYILSNVRSNVNQERVDLQQTLRTIGEKYGCTYAEAGVYSAWEYREDSELRKTMVDVFHQMKGEAPVVRVTHAGLECGTIGEKIPGLDCMSCGTNQRYIHTYAEKLEIASFGRSFAYVKELLKAL